jgi:plasmid stability protein
MSLTINLSPELERQLEVEAARNGQAPEVYARETVKEKLAAAFSSSQRARNQPAIELLDQWANEAPDRVEEAGYPLEITPLSPRDD